MGNEKVSRRKLLAASGLLACPWVASKLANAAAEDFSFEEVTKQSREANRRGTRWLMKTLHRDGSCGVDIGQPSDIGCTSIVGLALLSQGNTPVEGPHSRQLRQILAFILRAVEQMPSDDITSAQSTQLQNKIGRHAHTFFAALFLRFVFTYS